MDLSHNIGADLNVSASGDLAISSGTLYGQQRVLRRLISNPLDYVWHPDYGAGLGRFIGTPSAETAIRGTIRAQMREELAVAQSPPPAIAVSGTDDGTLTASVRYVDSVTLSPATLTVPVNG